MADPKKTNILKKEIRISFDQDTIDLKLDQIILIKIITEATRKSKRYKQIIASIRASGVIEHPVVALDRQSKGRYLLLDGHMRVEALKELGETEVTCLVSTDDESFTYNKHVNRLSTIQEHKMILKAVKRGVSEEKIAQALDINVGSIVKKRTLLVGICDEAVDLLKDKMVASRVFDSLRFMLSVRQIEAATLMNDSGIYTNSYAKSILAATPKSQLTNPQKPKKIKGLTEEQMDRMENEMTTLQREYRLVEESLGTDVLNLMCVRGYLTSLIGNAKVVRYLAQNHPEFLTHFQKMSEMTSLGGKEAAAA